MSPAGQPALLVPAHVITYHAYVITDYAYVMTDHVPWVTESSL